MKVIKITPKQEAAIAYTIDFFTNTMAGLPKHDLVHKQVKPYRKELMTLNRKLKRASGQTGT